MSDVLLISKTSDFENADYLDPRPMLEKAGVKDYKVVEIFDVAAIKASLQDAKVILITSGLLVDPTLADALNADLGRQLQEKVNDGASLLILSQRLLSEKGLKLPGFRGDLEIVPTLRTDPHNSANSNIGPKQNAGSHSAMWVPNIIDFENVKAIANGSSLGGVYWHYWSAVKPELWTSLVVDLDTQAPLVVEHITESGKGRVVLSSIALDFTRNQALFENLISLCINGSSNIGFLESGDSYSVENVYSSLVEQGQTPYRHDLSTYEGLQAAKDRLAGGLHRTLLISDSVSSEQLAEVGSSIESRAADGTLTVVTLTGANSAKSTIDVAITASQSAEPLLRSLSKAQLELSRGLLGNSIFDTSKPLLAIINSGLESDFSGDWAELTSALHAKKNQLGHLDGSFVSSSALIWIAAWRDQVSGSPEFKDAITKTLKHVEVASEKVALEDLVRGARYLARAGQLNGIVMAATSAELSICDVNTQSFETNLIIADLLFACPELGSQGLIQKTTKAILSQVKQLEEATVGNLSDAIFVLMNENSRVSQSQNQEIRIALGALHKQLVRLLKSTRNLDSLPLEIRANSAIYAYGQWLKTPIEPLTRLLISNLNVDAEEAKFADALEFATQARKSENKALELASQQTKRASRLLRERRFSRAIISGLILIASFAIGVILQTIFDPKAGGILATGVHEFIIGPVFSISNISFLIGLSAWSYQGWKYTEDDSELA